jgi:hypothetical protein
MIDPNSVEYKIITDDWIDEKSKDRVITDYQDFDLSRGEKWFKSRVYPVPGGVYDASFFGSIYTDTCNCGRVDTVGDICNMCGCKVMTTEEKYKRWARIDLDFYYVMNPKIQALLEFMRSLPIDASDALDFYEAKGLNKQSIFHICELCQFDYDEDEGIIRVKYEVDDDNKASYEGILKIITKYFPEKLNKFKTIVNKKILVTPAISRMVSFNPFEYRTKMTIPYLSSVYQAIVFQKRQIQECLSKETNPWDRTMIRGAFRRFLAKVPEDVTSILATSKENISRNTYSTRVGDSGRAPIVDDPNLKQDEVAIPTSLLYELFKVDFITYLSTELNIDSSQAEFMYLSALQSTIDLFKKYVTTRRVIMNRPPSLHRYNLMSFKVLPTDDAAIHFPILSVAPFNADFDGDCLSFFAVPLEMNEYVDSKISPATQIRYESSNQFLYKPNHEMIYALTLCTRVVGDPVSEANYFSIDDIEKDYEDQTIQYPCDVILYQSKPTTYAYEKICDILGVRVEVILGKQEPITMKNVYLILAYINSLENHVDVYHKLIQFALEVITIEGATVPSIEELVRTDLSGFVPKLQKMAEELDEHPENLGLIDEEYQKFLKDQIKNMPQDLYQRVAESGRIKLSQISEMFAPQMMINDDGSIFIADTSQAQGLSEKALRKQAMNNRIALGMKQELTPKGGYAARQIKFASQGVLMNRNEEDTENIGIYLKRSEAEGRTTLDGEKLDKSSDDSLVLVRSMAVSKNNYFTPDLISEEFHVYPHGSNLGLKFGSAAAGDVTQTGLSLKHSAQVTRLNQDTKLRARANCTIQRISPTEIVISEGNIKFKHYVPSDFILANTNCRKGDMIGYLPYFVTPEYVSDLLLDLLYVKSSTDITRPHTPQWAFNIAINSGKISYTEDYVIINGRRLPREKTKLYTFFEGDQVNAGDMLCNGVLNIRNIHNYCNNIQEEYFLFKTQLNHLLPVFNNNMLEFLFNCCYSWQDESHLVYVGIQNKVRKDKSVYANISYEGASRILSSVFTDIDSANAAPNDLYSSFMLNLMDSGKLFEDENQD